MNKEVFNGKIRPSNGERVIYYFEPFEQWYVGNYDSESDSVFGKNGFSTWRPEVKYWMKDDINE